MSKWSSWAELCFETSVCSSAGTECLGFPVQDTCSWVVTALWPWSWNSAPVLKHTCAFRQIPWCIWCWQVVWTPSNTLDDSGNKQHRPGIFLQWHFPHPPQELQNLHWVARPASPTSDSSAGLSVSSALTRLSGGAGPSYSLSSELAGPARRNGEISSKSKTTVLPGKQWVPCSSSMDSPGKVLHVLPIFICKGMFLYFFVDLHYVNCISWGILMQGEWPRRGALHILCTYAGVCIRVWRSPTLLLHPHGRWEK